MKTYMERCSFLENPKLTKANRDHWCLQYGINNRSPLCAIDGFDVTTNVIMDPMHVLLEGCTGHIMALFLNRCINSAGLFSLKWLNACIDTYDYSYLDKGNKPKEIMRDEIVKKEFVKQKAAALLLLCYVLPQILGDVFDDDDEYYNHFLIMIETPL